MAAPIYNPVIPCVHPIPGGLFPGRMIRMQGNIPPGAQRFAINLQCGPNTDPRDDIALHLNFRFMEMCVVRNHLTAMNWGVEETAGGMPLARGDNFEALILCEPQSVKVALNGVHFCEFLHRVPFQRISHFTIDGDVHVQFVAFEGAQPAQPMYMVRQSPRPPVALSGARSYQTVYVQSQHTRYRAEPPAYGSYGAPPPSYGAPGYGAPQGYAPVAAPGAYSTTMMSQPQRSGMGTGAAVGMGVGALAAGGLAGYALGGGFSSDSPTSEPVEENKEDGDDDYLENEGTTNDNVNTEPWKNNEITPFEENVADASDEATKPANEEPNVEPWENNEIPPYEENEADANAEATEVANEEPYEDVADDTAGDQDD